LEVDDDPLKTPLVVDDPLDMPLVVDEALEVKEHAFDEK